METRWLPETPSSGRLWLLALLWFTCLRKGARLVFREEREGWGPEGRGYYQGAAGLVWSVLVLFVFEAFSRSVAQGWL